MEACSMIYLGDGLCTFGERGMFFGECLFYFVFYSVIVQLLFLVHILILLIVCSFPTFPPAHLPLRDSPSNANPQLRRPIRLQPTSNPRRRCPKVPPVLAP